MEDTESVETEVNPLPATKSSLEASEDCMERICKAEVVCAPADAHTLARIKVFTTLTARELRGRDVDLSQAHLSILPTELLEIPLTYFPSCHNSAILHSSAFSLRSFCTF